MDVNSDHKHTHMEAAGGSVLGMRRQCRWYSQYWDARSILLGGLAAAAGAAAAADVLKLNIQHSL